MLPNQVIGLFEASLEQPDWIDDKVPDQFPESWGENDSRMPPPGSGSGAKNGDPSQGKKRGYSKSLTVDLEQALSKRPKADQ